MKTSCILHSETDSGRSCHTVQWRRPRVSRQRPWDVAPGHDLGMNSAQSTYLRSQYDDSSRLRTRTETHRLHSEAPYRLEDELLRHLDLRAGLDVLDVGCGPGRYHAAIARRAYALPRAASTGGAPRAPARGAIRRRVVLATNGSNYLACLAGLHREAALALG